MLRFVGFGLALSLLASCGVIQSTFGGIGGGAGSAKRASVQINQIRFRTRAVVDRADPRAFTVTATPVAADPATALEAARYQATRYCLLTYGNSDKEWVIGPDTPLSQVPVDGNALALTGRCTFR